MKRLLFWGAFALLAGTACAADLARVPEPEWVVPADWRAPRKASQASGDYEDLLKDYQINRVTHETYVRIAYRLLTPGAVQESANVSIDYAPEYQTVRLHRLALWRNGEVIDQRDIAFRSLHREEDLSRALYDGRETWVAFLRDAQPGDVLDLAYTVQGENPIFAGRFADTYRLETGFAVARWKLRIVAPAGRSPQIRSFGTTAVPQTSTRGSLEETLWNLEEVPKAAFDDNTPPDAVPGGRFVFSDWKTWGEVVVWALPDYSPKASSRVRQLANDLIRGVQEPQARAQALLRYVQDKIRYLGLEVGENSHRPHSPDSVLENGFGDCKDKALLFVSLAQAVGLEAWPVLVDTRLGNRVFTDGPTVLAFNHVIAAVSVPGGLRFVDPTAQFQGDRLEDQVLGDFRWGLEIRPGVTDLTALPGASAGTRSLVQTFRFADYSGPADVTMLFTFTGYDAAYQRDRWSRTEVEQWKKDIAEVLHDRHGSSSLTSGPTLTDDLRTNTVRLEYAYHVDELWSRDGSKQVAGFYPSLVGDMLEEPDSVNARTSPFWREHPVKVTQERRVEFPTDWALKPTEATVDGPSFHLTAKSRQVTPRLLVFEDTFVSSADRVAAGQWKEFLAALKKGRHEVSWSLTQQRESETTAPASVQDPSMVALGLGVIALIVFGIAVATQGTDF